VAGETTELELDMNVEPASMLRAVEKRRQATTGESQQRRKCTTCILARSQGLYFSPFL